jgi:hypothetical protein
MARAAPPQSDHKKPATQSKSAAEPKGSQEAKAPASKSTGPGHADANASQPKPQAASQGASQEAFARLAARPKLAVTQPGDAVEREADAMADAVMRQPKAAPAVAGTPKAANTAGTPPLQRQAQGAQTPGPERADPSGSKQPDSPEALKARLGPGEPMGVETRAFFEPRFGRDLSHVRVHNDAAAADAARSLHARAFTFGQHVVFAAGEYQPGEQGRQLMAHELAHVMQNDDMGLAAVVARKPKPPAAPNPAYADPNDISAAAIDPAKDKKARKDLETLRLPDIKSRHAPVYKKRAGKSLKRPAGYDRDKPAFATNQVSHWKKAVDLAPHYDSIGFDPAGGRQTLTWFGANQHTITGTVGEVVERLKIPSWAPDGSWFNSPLQVDHIVEVQVGGEDAFENYELLTGKHNTNVGSLLRSVIYANVKNYLAAVDKNTGDTLVKSYLKDKDIEFKDVEGGGAGKNPESTAQFWSRDQIVKGEHLKWLKDDPRAAKDDGTRKDRFALYSDTGAGFIDAFALKKNQVSVHNSGRLAGLKINKITLTGDLGQPGTGPVGTLEGTWDLPNTVKVNAGKTFSATLNRIGNKPYAGALASLTPPGMDVPGASPVAFEQISVVRGQVFADGTLTASHELFQGLKIPVRWRGDELAFEHTLTATDLSDTFKLPGITIDEASLTLLFGIKGLGADGHLGFTIKGFGAGDLTVGMRTGKEAPILYAKGALTADRKLFDLAQVELGYTTGEGFSGKGTLGITNPDKVKGIKSASLTVSYVNSVFTATGDVSPDIPGLASASLSVTYAEEQLQITGKLALDEKVPMAESADITVSVTQVGEQWKVGATGDVTPKIPGLSGAKLAFDYNDGTVLLEGSFKFEKGPLSGTVKAGVTNAAVDDKGQRAEQGEGGTFKAFGAADIDAKLIPDKLTGTLKLRLAPDGTVRVGGGLTVEEVQLFPRVPQGKAEFIDEKFDSPSVPVPGLGFSVGSVSVGVTLSATATLKAHAYIGPGTLKGVNIEVEEFDPSAIDINLLKFKGGGRFEVPGDAGVKVGAKLNLEFSAAVASLVGSVGLEAGVNIPEEKQPILGAKTDFTYSVNDGLDLSNTLSLTINPALTFRVFGEVSAKLNLLLKKVTVWSKDFTLAQASYQLPVGINATGTVGYNSKTGKITPETISDAFSIQQPTLDSSTLSEIARGKSGPPVVETTDDQGKVVDDAELMSSEPVCSMLPEEPNASYDPGQSFMPEDSSEPNQSVMPQRADGTPQTGAQAPTEVDDGVLQRLGAGQSLDIRTRGRMEQQLGADFSQVRVHTSPTAEREAERLQARAFTVGQDIAFAPGEYQPDSLEGQRLLAHELAHVLQQQRGVARQVMRLGEDEPDASPAASPAASSVDTDTAAPEATDAADASEPALGDITLPQLKLPSLKYTETDDNRHRHGAYQRALTAGVRRPAGYRRADLDSRQQSLWRRATPPGTLRTALQTVVSGLESDKVYVAVPRQRTLANAGNHVMVGRLNDLALALRQPRWTREGEPQDHPFEVDHIVELQIGGIGYDRIDNLELLERSANGASGRTIDRYMDEAFADYARSDAAASLPAEQRQAEVLKRRFNVRFGGFLAEGDPATGHRYTLDNVLAAQPAEGLRIHDPSNLTGAPSEGHALQPWPAGVDAARYTGSPNLLVLYPTKRGGQPKEVPLREGQPVDADRVLRDWVPGLTTTGLSLTLSESATGPMGHVRGSLVHAQLAEGARADVDIAIQRLPRLTNAGVLDTDALEERFRGILRAAGVTALSPVVLSDIDIVPGIGLTVHGHVEPTIALLRGTRLDFRILGNDLQVYKTFSGGELALGGPFRIDGCDLTVALGTRSGLTVDGGVAYSISRLGQGNLRGAASREGFRLTGDFQFDRTLFDGEASVRLAYERTADAPEGKLSGGGRLAIGPGKVRGIQRASVDASFDGEQRSIQGTADLSIPGVESATLGVTFDPEAGTVIRGAARFRDRPGLRNGRIEASLSQTSGADDWSLAASGTAEATFAGITATLEASYRNGLFMFAADAPFEVGERVRGRVRVGLTNGDVDDEGRLLDSPPAEGRGGGGAGAALRPFGNGTVTVRLTDWLEGGVGLKVRPSGDLLISGRIGIPEPITVFDQYPSPERAQRELGRMPTVSVPLVGLSLGGTVVGLALTINGRITGHAHVGPGRLTRTEVEVHDFNPAQPDSLRVTGGATFDLPAEAGVAASLDAGVSLGAAVIRATAGLSVSAEAALSARATPVVDIDWRPSTGLHLHAGLDASLTPRLAFNLNGYAEVVADAFVTSFTLWRKDWNLASRELGSNLALRLAVPVDYYSDGRGVVFDPQAVRFETPSLNGDTFSQLLNAPDAGTERTERGEREGRAARG